ncbi:MAG: glycoside hydrolase family 38 C-terminal domain-containing protein [Bacteroidales bacterium]|nr:glycoside hydrolase family 38 C-terminal domain-containing protein [Bacteroidales bacterium]
MATPMDTRTIHLICNSHIDPVWLWEWEEGLAETLSTFRIAAEFCSKFDGFVFCHNESLLYQWVEEYEPSLFRRIQRLVKEGKWRIIGGWYVQPDCNLPTGESFVRQILVGKNYLMEKFGVEPQTAVNFDPFGHTRGLVQILNKSGYTSYLFCRPGADHLEIPEDFIWKGFDGSEVLAHRSTEHYNSEKGKADEKFEKWLKTHSDVQQGLFLWGIGNHGGGPSKIDLGMLQKRIDNNKEIKHSWPEAYFADLEPRRSKLTLYNGDLNPWAVGCYTSMSRVKRMHRKLENIYYTAEKMLTHAVVAGLMKYPRKELREALEDLLFCEFHDILPGSAIPEVEVYAMQRMDHGLEILSRLKARAFFKLMTGQPVARKEEFPVLVYNPEPYDIDETLIVELQGPEPNFNPRVFWLPELTDESGNPVVYQLEKESANIANDHRKRLVFRARLKASSMNRFSCYLREVSILDKPMNPAQGELHFVNDTCEIRISPETGLIDQYKVNGKDYLKTDSAELLVMKDSADPWGMKVNSFRDPAGSFRLMSPSETAGFAGTQGPVEPVRIIEDGPVRVVVEGLFRYQVSTAVVRYLIPKQGAEVEISVRIFWMEKDKMLKMAFPGMLVNPDCLGQVAYGVQQFDREGEELVAQEWVGLFSNNDDLAFTVANQTTYGFDFSAGELRISLLRSPAYAGHPVDDLTPVVRQDRFTPRIDQGEHQFRFRINAGSKKERLESIDLESRLLNSGSMSLCCFPGKGGKIIEHAVTLSDSAVRIAAMKMAEKDDRLIVRLFETTGTSRKADLRIPLLDLNIPLEFNGFEVKTLSINRFTKEIATVDLLERM